MIINGVHHENITCGLCRMRHPPMPCHEAARIAAENRRLLANRITDEARETQTPKETAAPYAYLIEASGITKLRRLADRLQGGSDLERDAGHLLWYVLRDLQPVTESDVDAMVKARPGRTMAWSSSQVRGGIRSCCIYCSNTAIASACNWR